VGDGAELRHGRIHFRHLGNRAYPDGGVPSPGAAAGEEAGGRVIWEAFLFIA